MESTTFIRLGEVMTNEFIFVVKDNCLRFIEVKKYFDFEDAIYLCNSLCYT